METKFTKGPWVFEYPRKKRLYAKVSANDWSHFAKVVVRIEGIKEFSEEGLANVKLIASAPDLFNSCMEAKAMYEAMGINENSRIGGEQYSKLIQAIKKATE